MTGIVKKIVNDKNIGFILGSDGKDYFFHQSALKNCKMADLHEGCHVTFEDVEGTKDCERKTCMSEDICPECGEELEFDEVDIGVGTQCGKPHCESCGWYSGAEEISQTPTEDDAA